MAHQLVLGLGSNIEPRHHYLEQALNLLQQAWGTTTRCSSIIETAPWGFSSPHPFLNQVVILQTTNSPLSCLATTQRIEHTLGRKSKTTDGLYGDRPIDIDLLFYDSDTIDLPKLKIPHPHLHKRAFVLDSLVELLPEFVHPVLNQSIEQLISLLHQEQQHSTGDAVQ